MRKLKSILVKAAFLIAVALIMSSCLTTKTPVGNFRAESGSTYTYAKGKQIWLFWNLLPIGRTAVATPPTGSCQVITRFNFIDMFISGATAGIVSMETIKVEAKR